jgi:predicted GNAT superfamily acetyltransferase
LNSPHVVNLLNGEPQPIHAIERVTVPHTIYQWKQDAQRRSLAQELQASNREALQSAFSRGLAVVGYERDSDGNGSFLLSRWEEPKSIAAKSNEHKSEVNL